MSNLRNRVKQLEGVKREVIETVYKFKQEVRPDGNKFFFVDDAEVDAARYAKELAEHINANTNSKIPNELIIFSNGMDSKESITIFVDEETFESERLKENKT